MVATQPGPCHIQGMTDKRKRPRDTSQLAKAIVDIATGEATTLKTDTRGQRKGGLKGGKARAASMTPEERSEIAKLAAQARWKKN